MKIIAGVSGSGKTNKEMELAIEYAKQGKTSHIFSTECTPQDLILRGVRLSAGEENLKKINCTLIGYDSDVLWALRNSDADVIFVDSVVNRQNYDEVAGKLKKFEEESGKEVYVTVQVSRNNETFLDGEQVIYV